MIRRGGCSSSGRSGGRQRSGGGGSSLNACAYMGGRAFLDLPLACPEPNLHLP